MSTSAEEFSWLRMQGPLSVISMTPEDLRGESVRAYILMGPTGSGKSSFIEALSPHQDLAISKDTLESVTQKVTCYKAINLKCRLSFACYILIDTPGFLDTKLSEQRITSMIVETLSRLRENADTMLVSILYFLPITDIRIGGSKRDAVKLLRAFARAYRPTGINVVTTMWNNILRRQQMDDANRRYESLREEVFVPDNEISIEVGKFDLTKGSALSALNVVERGWFHGRYKSVDLGTEYQNLACSNLLERITNAQHQLCTLNEDKKILTIPGAEDLNLLKVFLREEKVALEALEDFLDDLYYLNSEIYRFKFPDLPFPRLPRHSRSLSTRFKHAIAPITGVVTKRR
ncbi:hypothetical protein BJ165DRAFT_1597072 [Panaeolus papilionaceus]|nr:hypothetical protein BJ165DRAFT_1597072 [Panaeolus papilionaceus]